MVKVGYSIGLYAKFKGIDNKQAFKELLEREAFSVNRSKYTIDTNNQIIDIDTRDTTYKAFLEKLELSSDHKRVLLEYGFPETYLIRNNFKSIPDKPTKMKETIKHKMLMHYMKNKCTLEGVAGFHQTEDFSWTYTSADGFFIPVLDVDSKIQGLLIRLDKEFHRCKTSMVF